MQSTQPGYLDHKDWYPSTDYKDELAINALLLYMYTNDSSYLIQAENYYTSCCNYGGWAYDWDEKTALLNVMLFKVTQKQIYKDNSKQFFDDWINHVVPHTPLGLGFRYFWGSNRYAANTAYLCFVHAKNLRTLNPNDAYATQVFNYGESQINYIGGSHGRRSWIVGFGNNYAKLPYHKSSYNAYISYPTRDQSIDSQRDDFLYSTRQNTFILYGAVVGGPKVDDTYVDNRHNYEYTEVTLDYNAGFTGAAAGLVAKYGGVPFTDTGLDLGWSHSNATAPPTPTSAPPTPTPAPPTPTPAPPTPTPAPPTPTPAPPTPTPAPPTPTPAPPTPTPAPNCANPPCFSIVSAPSSISTPSTITVTLSWYALPAQNYKFIEIDLLTTSWGYVGGTGVVDISSQTSPKSFQISIPQRPSGSSLILKAYLLKPGGSWNSPATKTLSKTITIN
jgi:hypothetical protein